MRIHRGWLALVLLFGGWCQAQERMTLEQLSGQVMLPSVAADRVLAHGEELRALEEMVRTSAIGGVHMLRSSVQGVATLSARLQALAPHPLFISADCEGGAGIMFPGATRFPRALALAACADLDLIGRVAKCTAEESALVGVNVVFAPVADVNSSPSNPIINLRSFGDQPHAVAERVAMYGAAMESRGLMAVSKHFPGHGDTHEDSHLGLPVVDLPLSTLEKRELIPFEAAVRAGISGVMSAHIAWPQLGGKDAWPATLEPKVITGLLREKLGFSGIVFTDALDMGGITRRAAAGEAAVRAILAGCDVLLFPTDIPAMRRALVEAVESGRIPRAHFEASTARVLKARERWKTLRAAKLEELKPLLQTKEAVALAEECARRSIVRLRGSEKPPIEQVLVLHDPQEDWGFDKVPEAFMSALRAAGVNAPVRLDSGRARSGQEPLADWSRALVLSAASLSPAADKDAATAAARRRSLLQLAVKGGAALVLLGNPLAHGPLPDGQGALLVGLDFDDHTQRALVLALTAGGPAEGHLPLEVPGLAPRGAGLGR